MSDYTRFEHLRISVESAVATVTLAPVEQRDLESSSFADLRDVWTVLGDDREVSSVVLASSAATFNPSQPRKNAEMLRNAPIADRAARLLTVQQFAMQMLSFRKPVVAAVNGPAYGLGAQLAFFSDSAVATDAVVFGDRHVEHGLAAGDGGTMMWPLIVGVPRARRLVAHGHVITAQEALALGLIEALVAPDELIPRATEIAQRLAALPELPFMASKLAINNWFRLSSLVSWDLAAAYEATTLSSWSA